MDTSKEYIKMCDCPEIQGQWEVKNRDTFYHRGDEEGHWKGEIVDLSEECDDTYCECENCGWGEDVVKKYGLWLPRQDQIQEMIPQCNCSTCLVEEFYHFFERNIEGFFEAKIESMEQLWLAFYMSENHQKIWDAKKEKWVKSAKE